MRTLSWKHTLGLVTMDVELADRTLSVAVTPVQAVVLLYFQDQGEPPTSSQPAPAMPPRGPPAKHLLTSGKPDGAHVAGVEGGKARPCPVGAVAPASPHSQLDPGRAEQGGQDARGAAAAADVGVAAAGRAAGGAGRDLLGRGGGAAARPGQPGAHRQR